MTMGAPRDSGPKKPRRSTSRTPLLPKHVADHHPHPYDGAGFPEGGFDGASFPGAVFNLATTIVGAGIMALPAAVKVLGIISGVLAILAAALLTRSSVNMILRLGRPVCGSPSASPSKGHTSYAAVVGDAFGSSGRAMLQACIIVNNLGMLVVYMIIIGDVLSGTSSDGGGPHHTGVLEGWFGRHCWTGRGPVLLFTTVFVFAPLISFKRVDSLSYTSALSVALSVVFVVITSGMAVVKILEGRVGMPRLLPGVVDQESFLKLFTTVPVLVTAYICHYSIHPIENELKDPNQMKSIVNASMLLCCVVYVATSVFALLLFGDATMDDVLANFDGDMGFRSYGALLNDVVRVSYAAHLMLVFPIVFFSLRLNVDGLLFPMAKPINFDGRRFFVVTVVLMGVVFLGATLVPSIWDAFQFTGATAAVAIAFLFPASLALRDIHGAATRKDKVLSWVMILLGISSSTIAISTDLYDLFQSSEIAT